MSYNTPNSEPDHVESRYYVKKINDTVGKHDGCRYFVLDPQHDPHAVTGLRAYAEAVRSELPGLAADLDAWIEEDK